MVESPNDSHKRGFKATLTVRFSLDVTVRVANLVHVSHIRKASSPRRGYSRQKKACPNRSREIERVDKRMLVKRGGEWGAGRTRQ